MGTFGEGAEVDRFIILCDGTIFKNVLIFGYAEV